MRKLFVILLVLTLAVATVACGGGEETTLTGMVVSVEGTVVSVVENGGNRGNGAERPEGTPGGVGGNFEDFNPEDFGGTMPTGEGFPKWGGDEWPEGATMPEGMTRPERGEMPGDMTLPEGMTMPENGQMPDFGGMDGKTGNFADDVETKDVDISGAHISVEIDGGKASGSISDVKAGSMVTITLDGKGKATNVLVSSQSI